MDLCLGRGGEGGGGLVYYASYQKRRLKKKRNMALRARFQMLILACFFFKQPINVSYFDILALLSHLNNKTRKKDVFTGCSEIVCYS